MEVVELVWSKEVEESVFNMVDRRGKISLIKEKARQNFYEQEDQHNVLQ